MRLAFNYPCHVGIITVDGDMTTMVFPVGAVIDVHNVGCLIASSRTHQDFEMTDGTLLKDVPLVAVRLEPELWQSV